MAGVKVTLVSVVVFVVRARVVVALSVAVLFHELVLGLQVDVQGLPIIASPIIRHLTNDNLGDAVAVDQKVALSKRHHWPPEVVDTILHLVVHVQVILKSGTKIKA